MAFDPRFGNRNVANLMSAIHNALNSIPSMTGIEQLSMEDTGGVKKVATDKVIASFEKLDPCDSDIDCPICMDDFKEVKGIKMPCCKQVCHLECLKTWLKENNTCPMCRHEYPYREVSMRPEVTRETPGETPSATTPSASWLPPEVQEQLRSGELQSIFSSPETMSFARELREAMNEQIPSSGPIPAGIRVTPELARQSRALLSNPAVSAMMRSLEPIVLGRSMQTPSGIRRRVRMEFGPSVTITGQSPVTTGGEDSDDELQRAILESLKDAGNH